MMKTEHLLKVAAFATERELAGVWPLLSREFANPSALDALWKAAFVRRAQRLFGRSNNRLPPGVRLDTPIGIVRSPVLESLKWWTICNRDDSNAEKQDEKQDDGKAEVKHASKDTKTKEGEGGWISVSPASDRWLSPQSGWRVRVRPPSCAESTPGERWCWRDRWSVLGFLCVCDLREYWLFRKHRPKCAPDLSTHETMDLLDGKKPRSPPPTDDDEKAEAERRLVEEGDWVPHGTFAKKGDQMIHTMLSHRILETGIANILLRSVGGPDQSDDKNLVVSLFLMPCVATAKRWTSEKRLAEESKARLQDLLQELRELPKPQPKTDQEGRRPPKRQKEEAPRQSADPVSEKIVDLVSEIAEAALLAEVPFPEECEQWAPEAASFDARPAYVLTEMDVGFACSAHGFDMACGCRKGLWYGPDDFRSSFFTTVMSILTENPAKDIQAVQPLIALNEADPQRFRQPIMSCPDGWMCLAAHGHRPALVNLIAHTSRLQTDCEHAGHHAAQTSLFGDVRHLRSVAVANGVARLASRGPEALQDLLYELLRLRDLELAALSDLARQTALVAVERRAQYHRRQLRDQYRRERDQRKKASREAALVADSPSTATSDSKHVGDVTGKRRRPRTPSPPKTPEPDFGDCGDGVETVKPDGTTVWRRAPDSENQKLEEAARARLYTIHGDIRERGRSAARASTAVVFDAACGTSRSSFDSMRTALQMLIESAPPPTTGPSILSPTSRATSKTIAPAFRAWMAQITDGDPAPVRLVEALCTSADVRQELDMDRYRLPSLGPTSVSSSSSSANSAVKSAVASEVEPDQHGGDGVDWQWRRNGGLEVAERVASLFMPHADIYPGLVSLVDNMCGACLKIIDSTEVTTPAAARAAYVLACLLHGASVHRFLRPLSPASIIWATRDEPTAMSQAGRVFREACRWLRKMQASGDEWAGVPFVTNSFATEEKGGRKSTKTQDTTTLIEAKTLRRQHVEVSEASRTVAIHQQPVGLESDVRWLLELRRDNAHALDGALAERRQPAPTDGSSQGTLSKGTSARTESAALSLLENVSSGYNRSSLLSFHGDICALLLVRQMDEKREHFVQIIRKLHDPSKTPWFVIGPHAASESDLTGWASFSRFYVLVREPDEGPTGPYQKALGKAESLDAKMDQRFNPNNGPPRKKDAEEKRRPFMYALAVDACDTGPVIRLRPFPGSKIAHGYNDWIPDIKKIEGTFDRSKLPLPEKAREVVLAAAKEAGLDVLTEEQFTAVAPGLILPNEPRIPYRDDDRLDQLQLGTHLLFSTSGSFNDQFGLRPSGNSSSNDPFDDSD